MAVFRDESGRRARALLIATVLGTVGAAAAVGVFLVSVFPAPWSRKGVEPEPPPVAHLLENRAREGAYRREEDRLKSLLHEAEQAQKRRKHADAREPVLAAFSVNWDSQSVRSLEQHADQLTHVMPEWVRVAKDGTFVVSDDARVMKAAARLDVTPTVQNYGETGFDRTLVAGMLAND